MSRVSNVVDGPTPLDQVWGKRPDYYDVFMSDYTASVRRADPVLVELCRIRIAQLVESVFDLSLRWEAARVAGLDEAKIAAVTRYPESELFSERERAVLEFAEQFAIQSSSISDEDVLRVQAHLTDEEFIYLTKALGVIDQFARSNSAFRLGAADTVPPSMPGFVLTPATSEDL
jgi:alkylhydroperoxidase family enzyme